MDCEASPTEESPEVNVASPVVQLRGRRSPTFKAQVLTAQSLVPPLPAWPVAVRHGLNPNMVHTWCIAQVSAEPQAYLRDVLERLPATRYSDIDSRLPHTWTAPIKMG